jgi:hypothetical protein
MTKSFLKTGGKIRGAAETGLECDFRYIEAAVPE